MAKFFLDDLRVYAMSETLADAISELVATWDSFAKTTVGKQPVRAADSVGAPREDKRRLQKLLTELLPALNAYLTSLKPHKSVEG